MFSIKNLTIHLASSGKPVVVNCTFSVQPGQIMALTGANGSGKSSLLNALMGHPAYGITEGDICLDEESLSLLSPNQKARKGMFLASQHPIAVPGLRVETLLKESYRSLYGEIPTLDQWHNNLQQACDAVGLPHEVLERNVGVEFSGGQQKRLEMLQALVLKPKLLLLDELDSGLDEQGVIQLSRALQAYRRAHPATIMIIVSHHNALLQELIPDVVRSMDHGKLHVQQGYL